MNIEEQLLSESISDTIHEADRALVKYFRLREITNEKNIEHGDHADELEMAEDYLKNRIEKIFTDVGILAERLGLPSFCKQVRRERKKFPDLSDANVTPWDIGFHSPSLAAARGLYSSLATMTKGRAVTGLGVFETVLENTGKIIERANLKPKNEKAVQKAVIAALQICFRDVTPEVSIGKNLKTYKPDIGVRSLMAAAEYKFIDSPEEAKNAIGGIFEDMHGYAGHSEWRNFYAVLYTTKNFYDRKDIEAEFKRAQAAPNWTPIVIVGPGGRVRKTAKLAIDARTGAAD